MDDWKIIKRETKAESEWTTRSLRLPKDLDDYCNQQGNASDFIRDLITQHKEGHAIVELTDAEEEIRASIMRSYIKQNKWLKKCFYSGETYPSLEAITDAELNRLLDVVLNDPILNHNAAFKQTDADALRLAERCKLDKELWKKVYAKIRSDEWTRV